VRFFGLRGPQGSIVCVFDSHLQICVPIFWTFFSLHIWLWMFVGSLSDGILVHSSRPFILQPQRVSGRFFYPPSPLLFSVFTWDRCCLCVLFVCYLLGMLWRGPSQFFLLFMDSEAVSLFWSLNTCIYWAGFRRSNLTVLPRVPVVLRSHLCEMGFSSSFSFFSFPPPFLFPLFSFSPFFFFFSLFFFPLLFDLLLIPTAINHFVVICAPSAP